MIFILSYFFSGFMCEFSGFRGLLFRSRSYSFCEINGWRTPSAKTIKIPAAASSTEIVSNPLVMLREKSKMTFNKYEIVETLSLAWNVVSLLFGVRDVLKTLRQTLLLRCECGNSLSLSFSSRERELNEGFSESFPFPLSPFSPCFHLLSARTPSPIV